MTQITDALDVGSGDSVNPDVLRSAVLGLTDTLEDLASNGGADLPAPLASAVDQLTSTLSDLGLDENSGASQINDAVDQITSALSGLSLDDGSGSPLEGALAQLQGTLEGLLGGLLGGLTSGGSGLGLR